MVDADEHECEWCGAPAKKKGGLCENCQRTFWRAGADTRQFVPTPDYRDLLSDETRRRLEEWEHNR